MCEEVLQRRQHMNLKEANEGLEIGIPEQEHGAKALEIYKMYGGRNSE